MKHTLSRRARFVVGSSAVALVLVACGSTVQYRAGQTLTNNDQSGLGSAVAPPGTTIGPNGLPTTPGSTLPGQTPGGGTFAGGGGGTVTGASGPGITKDKIYVGVIYVDNPDTVNQATGVSISQGDAKAVTNIVMKDLNKRGGIAGRQVVPVWHRFDNASNDSIQSSYEAACQTFTKDHHVFAVLEGQAGVPNFNECVSKSGAVQVNINVTDSDARTFQQFPYKVEPESLAIDHFASAEVPALVAQNYFGKNPKIGVLTFDTPNFGRALYGALLPALKRYGYTVDPANISRVSPIRRASDEGALSAAVSSTVLKFNTNHVDHVLFIQASGDLGLFFLLAAQNQGYYPRYGFNSADAPQLLLDGTRGSIQQRNFQGAVGIGWGPTGDLRREDYPKSLETPERKYCLDIMRKGGQSFPDNNALSIALNTCDTFWFLKRVAEAAGPILNHNTFMAAVNGLGRLWRASDAMGTFFGPNKHDGINGYSYYVYVDACGCMRYKGSPHFIE